jgi:uncharacterized protein YqhQ
MEQEKKNYIGGQAVIEGVMMRGQSIYSVAVRNSKNEIETVNTKLKKYDNKFSIRKIPIVRGIVSFIDSLLLGVNIITISSDIAIDDDENDAPNKFEKFLLDIFGDKLNDIVMYISMIFSLVIAISVFMLLPIWLATFLSDFTNDKPWIIGVFEGLIRIVIFIAYIYIISRLKDIQRLFMYHGAEHKTINCLESEDNLTVENVKKHSRLHKRCGTSFLLIVMLISMIVFTFVRTDIVVIRLLFRIVLVPVIAGISYEIIRWAGKNDSVFVTLISAPGLALQKLTTSEPDDLQIEVAIAAVNEVLKNGG